MKRLILLLGIIGFFSLSAQAQTETLIRNATVLTVTHGTLTNTDVLMRNGKIAAIGKNLKASANARVIDATGKYVMPGIIDCHSHSMLDTINEGTLAVTSMVRTQDVMNPGDVDLYRELAGGVTTLNLLHGSANPIGGLNTVVKIKYGQPVEEFIFPGAMPGIKFALGENPKRSNNPNLPGVTRRYPGTRMGVEEVIRDAFTRARNYKKTYQKKPPNVKCSRLHIAGRRSLAVLITLFPLPLNGHRN